MIGHPRDNNYTKKEKRMPKRPPNQNNLKHGHCRHGKVTPEYYVWRTIKLRCRNKSYYGYTNYGGKGINVCDKWFNDFSEFFKDMGARPSRGHQIDRIDNNGNYEPGNCRWATVKEQANNRNNTHKITHNDQTKTISEWAKILNMKHDTLYSRLKKGWSVEKSFHKPIRRKHE